MEADYLPMDVQERRKSSWRETILQYTPHAAIGIIVFAVAIALIARDVSKTSEIAAMNSKMASLEASFTATTQAYEARLAEAQAAMLQTSAQSNLVAHSIRQYVPQACRLECHNGGKPDDMCMKCTECNEGFGGRWCHVPIACASKCDMDTKQCSCRRGGSLDPNTCKCICPAGWAGERCSIANVTSVSLEDRRSFLDSLFQQAQEKHIKIAEQRKRAALYGTATLPNHLGNGASGYTRALKLSVLEPTYPSDLASARRFVSPVSGINYVIPERVLFEVSANTAPVMRSEIFNDMKDYVAYLQNLRSSTSQVPSSLFLKSITDMVQLFQTYPESFVTVAQQIRSLFTVKFDISSSGSYESFRLEDNCARALDYLPNEYNADSKPLYEQFLDYWGDSFVVESTEGGYVESIHGLHKGICQSFAGRASNAYLSQQQRNFMGKFYGLPGAWTVENTYEASAARDAGGCSGGNVVMCEEQLKSKVDYTPWTNTLWDLPSAVSVKLRPMTDMIRDPVKKAAMQAAIDARNNEATQNYISYTGRTAEFCPGGTYPPRPDDWEPIYGRPRQSRYYWKPWLDTRYYEP